MRRDRLAWALAGLGACSLALWWGWPSEAVAVAAPATAAATAAAPSAAVAAPVATHPMLAAERTDPRDRDDDHNGLPDDLDRHIATEYANAPAARRAIVELAHGWMDAVNEVHDVAAARQVGGRIARGIACMLSPAVTEEAGVDVLEMRNRMLETRAQALGTPARTEGYLRFQHYADGLYFDDPGENSCDFGAASPAAQTAT